MDSEVGNSSAKDNTHSGGKGVCIFEKEEFPKSQRKLYWLWILFQFGAGKTQQHFAASIIMYIYIYT